jgi:hypothetical protein
MESGRITDVGYGDPDDEVDDDLENLFRIEDKMRTTVFEFFGLRDSSSFKPREKKRMADPPDA